MKSSVNFASLAGGAITSILALALVFLLNAVEFNPLGFYVWFIVPVGALIVGLLAGSGYSLGSWFSNSPVNTTSMVLIFVLGICTYLMAHFLTFANWAMAAGEPEAIGLLGFLDYMVFLGQNLTYASTDAGTGEGTELGSFGYILLGIECIGFALGGIIPLAIVGGMPYCESCESYLQSSPNRYIHSEHFSDELKKKSKAEKEQILTAAIQELLQTEQKLLSALPTNTPAETEQMLDELPIKHNAKALCALEICRKKCPHCDLQHYKVNLTNQTVSGETANNPLYETYTVDPELAQQFDIDPTTHLEDG